MKIRWTTYEHPSPRFTIEIPDGWSTHTGLLGGLVAIAEPERDRAEGFASNVNILAVLPLKDMDEYMKRQVDALSEALVDLRLLRVSSDDGGRLGQIECVYRHTTIDLRLRQRHVLTDERAYVLSATAPAERFDALAPTFERMLTSFRS